MHTLFLDIETSVKNRGDEAVGNNRASPFHPANKVVLFGFVYDGIEEVSTMSWCPAGFGTTPDVIVGHNVKFDLHYLNKTFNVGGWIKQGGRIWDTMVAEWVLSGMESTFQNKGSLSLDGCCKKYGFPLKDDKIKEYWDKGVDTEDIPTEELEAYLIQDVENTRRLFHVQVERAVESGQLTLIHELMDSVLATWMMESGGMKFDRVQCTIDTEVLEEELTKLAVDFDEMTPYHLNISSGQHISALLFGGKLKYKEQEWDGTYFKTGRKKGMKRMKWVDKVHEITPIVANLDRYSTKLKTGWYKVDDEVLSNIQDNYKLAPVDNILRYRQLNKLVSTYMRGYSNNVWHDGMIRPSYNHGATPTGRLSCSNPNIQNVSGRGDD